MRCRLCPGSMELEPGTIKTPLAGELVVWRCTHCGWRSAVPPGSKTVGPQPTSRRRKR